MIRARAGACGLQASELQSLFQLSYGSLLVKHGDSCARERQVDEHILIVERLEGEPSQVAQASADATEGHLGHSLCREAREAVAGAGSQSMSMLRTVSSWVPARTERKWKCSEAPFIGLCGCRLPSCICDSRRLSSCLARPAPVGQQVDLRARVVVSKSHERSHEFREGTGHGDVVLRHARRHRGLLRVHRGVAEHKRPS